MRILSCHFGYHLYTSSGARIEHKHTLYCVVMFANNFFKEENTIENIFSYAINIFFYLCFSSYFLFTYHQHTIFLRKPFVLITIIILVLLLAAAMSHHHNHDENVLTAMLHNKHEFPMCVRFVTNPKTLPYLQRRCAHHFENTMTTTIFNSTTYFLLTAAISPVYRTFD